MNILVYRRLSDKKTVTDHIQVDKVFRVSQMIGDYIHFKTQLTATGKFPKDSQVYITREALDSLPPVRFNLIKDLFGEDNINLVGESYSTQRNKPHVYTQVPQMTEEQKVTKRINAAKYSKILEEKKHDQG